MPPIQALTRNVCPAPLRHSQSQQARRHHVAPRRRSRRQTRAAGEGRPRGNARSAGDRRAGRLRRQGDATDRAGAGAARSRTTRRSCSAARATPTTSPARDRGSRCQRDITREEIESRLPAFVGRIEQVPPSFSAVHVDGRRATSGHGRGRASSWRHGRSKSFDWRSRGLRILNSSWTSIAARAPTSVRSAVISVACSAAEP